MVEREPDVIDEGFIRDFVDRYGEARNSRDAEKVVALCSKDMAYVDASNPRKGQGREVIRLLLLELFRTVEDIRFQVVGGPYLALDGRSAAARWLVTGTMKRASGSYADLEFETAEFYEFSEDLIDHYTIVLRELTAPRRARP